MQLPEYLRRAIDRQVHGHSLSELSAAAAALSASYRRSASSVERQERPGERAKYDERPASARYHERSARPGRDDRSARISHDERTGGASNEERPARLSRQLDRLAYLTTRLPSTYAAARAALLDTATRLPAGRIETLLDLGGGPGTASHAAAEIFFGLREITLIEEDRGWFTLGKSLADESPYPAMQAAYWRDLDLTRLSYLAPHDLVLLSYVVGELDEKRLVEVVRMAWQAARVALVIIEPGTPRAFARLRFLREVLLHGGAHMVGPCPHENACPMAWSPRQADQRPQAVVPTEEELDWCHFSSRVERSSLHRRAKGGTLGFEDEKYSYIAVSRAAVSLPAARIIRRPIHTSGSVVLRLCTTSGLQAEGVSRSKPLAFRAAKKGRWGDVWQATEGSAPVWPESVRKSGSPAVPEDGQDDVSEKKTARGEKTVREEPRAPRLLGPSLPSPLTAPGVAESGGGSAMNPAHLAQVRLGFGKGAK